MLHRVGLRSQGQTHLNILSQSNLKPHGTAVTYENSGTPQALVKLRRHRQQKHGWIMDGSCVPTNHWLPFASSWAYMPDSYLIHLDNAVTTSSGITPHMAKNPVIQAHLPRQELPQPRGNGPTGQKWGNDNAGSSDQAPDWRQQGQNSKQWCRQPQGPRHQGYCMSCACLPVLKRCDTTASPGSQLTNS